MIDSDFYLQQVWILHLDVKVENIQLWISTSLNLILNDLCRPQVVFRLEKFSKTEYFPTNRIISLSSRTCKFSNLNQALLSRATAADGRCPGSLFPLKNVKDLQRKVKDIKKSKSCFPKFSNFLINFFKLNFFLEFCRCTAIWLFSTITHIALFQIFIRTPA